VATDYRIFDEPRPGGLARLAVRPLWPLLAVMFGGSWISWPWFVLNAYAVGSPTRRRETALAGAGFVGTAALLVALLGLESNGVLSGVAMRYAVVSLVVWKLLVSYWLFILQGRSFALFEHFHGATRNGMLVVFAGFYVSLYLLPRLTELGPLGSLLRLVLQ
jgi:hypothetical protein